jgi:hypothetical protein
VPATALKPSTLLEPQKRMATAAALDHRDSAASDRTGVVTLAAIGGTAAERSLDTDEFEESKTVGRTVLPASRELNDGGGF